MSLITRDELARGAILVTFGGAAGAATIAFPGSAVWLVPAGLGVLAGAATVPEVRAELRAALPALALPAPPAGRPALMSALWRLPGISRPVPAGEPSPAGGTAPPATAPSVRDPLFAALAERPHQLVIGHTGGGKTTLLHALATDWASAGRQVLVCDPDASPGQWPGCHAVGGGDDYAAVSRTFRLVRGIVAERRQQRSEGQRSFPPVHLVIDEVQDVLSEVDGAWGLLEPILRRGRKLGVHLTLGVQDSQRSTLDLDGKTHLLRNLAVVDLHQEPDGRRVARFRESRRELPTPALPDPESFIVERGALARASSPAADSLLGALLGQSVPQASGRARNAFESVTQSVPVPRNSNGNALTESERYLGIRTPEERSAPVTVAVNVAAVAIAAGGRRRIGRGGRIDIQSRRRQAAYRQAGAEGRSFRSTYAELGGTRDPAFRAWQAGRAARPALPDSLVPAAD